MDYEELVTAQPVLAKARAGSAGAREMTVGIVSVSS
jgi:hypothetical protein